jgi:hypothetical protein
MRFSLTPHRHAGWLLAGALLLVLSACGAGSTVSAPPTATPTAVPPTATATPRPSLQAQLVTHLFDSIAPNTNSPIFDLKCPTGYVIAGGGVNSGYATIAPMEDAPISADTWRAEIFNTSTTQTIGVQVQVDCLKGVGVTLASQIVNGSLGTVDVGSAGSAVVNCPAGYVVGGGGFFTGYPTFNPVDDSPISATSWRAGVYNTGSSAINVQANVACLSAPGLNAQVIARTLGNAPPNTNSPSVDAACPAGAFVGGGGLKGDGNYTWIELWNAPTDTQTFRGEEFNSSPIHSFTPQIQFVCLSLS